MKIPEAEAKQLAGAISDWRDSDDFTSDHGAESDYYQRLQPPYRPRNGNIRNWQELAYLRGMSPELLQLLRESFTLDGPGQAVLADYAPRGALAALSDLPEATIKIALEHQQFGGLGEQRVELREIFLTAKRLLFRKSRLFPRTRTWCASALPDHNTFDIFATTLRAAKFLANGKRHKHSERNV